MAKDKIHFIMTGGTIDSYYDGIKDTAVPNKHSVIPEYLKTLKLSIALDFTEICMKDSRNLKIGDIKKILKAVEGSNAKYVVISHGTYTMDTTARYLKLHMKRKDKTIIITGSMIPLELTRSDAPFNLGYTLAKIALIKPGVYVCMNGQIFTAEETSKIITDGRFISLFG